MLAEKREDGGKRRGKQFLMLCVILFIAGSANATVPDERISKRAQRQNSRSKSE